MEYWKSLRPLPHNIVITGDLPLAELVNTDLFIRNLKKAKLTTDQIGEVTELILRVAESSHIATVSHLRKKIASQEDLNLGMSETGVLKRLFSEEDPFIGQKKR